MSAESRLVRTCRLVSEIGELREGGVIDDAYGSTNDDLLGAVEEVEAAIRTWRYERYEPTRS